MNFDRGFIKWQPFNSVISNKTVLKNLTQNHKVTKPLLFSEELDKLNEQIKEAYYSCNEIILTFYEQNEIKKLKTTIIKIESSTNLIYLKNHKVITFSQILQLENI